jgi:hypothetical protein
MHARRRARALVRAVRRALLRAVREWLHAVHGAHRGGAKVKATVSDQLDRVLR